MRALQQAVEQVLETSTNGTRTLVRDENTLLLYDNEFVSQHSMQHILERCPLTEISVQQCDASSSGYIVQFTITDTPSPLTSAAFMFLLQCGMVVLGIHACGLLDALFAS
jgi:hypothetical protein